MGGCEIRDMRHEMKLFCLSTLLDHSSHISHLTSHMSDLTCVGPPWRDMGEASSGRDVCVEEASE